MAPGDHFDRPIDQSHRRPSCPAAALRSGILRRDDLLALAKRVAGIELVLVEIDGTLAGLARGNALANAVAADVIALQNAPPPPANALFNGNEYTQYGVTLSSDVAPSPQGASSSTDAASAQHTSVSAVADVQHAPPPPDTVDPAHITDHHAIL